MLLLVSLTVFVGMLCDVVIDRWWSGYRRTAVTVVVVFVAITVGVFQLM